MTSKTLTTGEAAKRLGVSLRTVQLWTANGTLATTRTPGRHRRILDSDVDALLRSMRSVDVLVEEGGDTIEHTSQSMLLLAGKVEVALNKGSLDRQDPQRYVNLAVLALRQYAARLRNEELAAQEGVSS